MNIRSRSSNRAGASKRVWVPVLILLSAAAASGQGPRVACTTQTQTPDTIRNEGATEQVADYVFSCINSGQFATTATIQANIGPAGTPVTSKVLNAVTGVTEATVLVQDSTGRQGTATVQGTVSGSNITFSNVPIPISTNTSNYQPFIMTITNVRVDATGLGAASFVSESVSITGTGVTTANFAAVQIAEVQPGLGAQTITGVTNFPVCSGVTAANAAFTVKFGESSLSPAALKTKGSGNTVVGSWQTNNTESGYSVLVGNTFNTANSGTRLRIVFNNIPANVSVYVPIGPTTDQLLRSGAPAGNLSLTASEAGAYSAVAPSANPAGYTGAASLALLTVSNNTAEAVYEVVGDSPTTVETYTLPVYFSAANAVAPQAAATSATVSFAPIGSAANIPDFAVQSSTTPLTGSLFPSCLVITTNSLPAGVMNLAYSQPVASSGGVLPYTWAVATGSLPPGLMLNTGTGVISGTPTSTSTNYNFGIRVTDSSGQTAVSTNYSVYIYPPLAITTNFRLPDGAVGETYNAPISATGGYGSYTWSITAGQLPPGLRLTAAGAVTGTPTSSGFYTSATAQVLDTSGATASTPVNILIHIALAISTASFPTAVQGDSYQTQATAAQNSGLGGYGWSSTTDLSGTGLQFSATGVLSGTPTAAAQAASPIALNVTLTDQGGATVSKTIPININVPISIPAQTFPTAVSGVSYNYQLNIVGGASNLNCGVYSGSLTGSGLSVSGTGLFTGTANLTGTYTFVVRCYDVYGTFALSPTLTLNVNPPVSILTLTLPGGSPGTSYNQTLAASGGVTPYSWSIVAGSLPANLTLNGSTGAITGPPLSIGSSTFTIKVTDANTPVPGTATQQYTITFTYPPLNLDFPDLVDSYGPLAYFRLNGASNMSEVGPYTYTPSAAPSASTAGPGAPITGVDVAYTKLDGVSGSVGTSLSGGIGAAATMMAWVNLAQLPSAYSSTASFLYVGGESQVGNDFDLQFITANNSLGFYTTNGGQYLSYTPNPLTLAGQWHMIAVTFDNAAGRRVIYWDGVQVAADTTQSIPNKTAQFAIGASPVFGGRNFPGGIEEAAVWNTALSASQVQRLFWLSSILPSGILNAAYPAVTLNPTGGSGNYTFSATPLPAGITLGSQGQFNGTPTATGTTSPITVTVHDAAANQSVTQTFSLSVLAPVTISSTLPSGVAGTAYNATVAASGGSGAGYLYSVSAGSLPGGFALAPTTGVISGTPNAAANYTFTIQAVDGLGNTGSQQYTVSISTGVTVSTTSLPNSDQGSVYVSQTLTATGGSGTYTWAVTAGELPISIGLSPAGVLSGAPGENGIFYFTVTATDSNGFAGSQGLTLTINPALSFLATSLPNGTVGVPYNQTLGASGGSGTYLFSVASGPLPAGLSLNASTGVVNGTPTAAVSNVYISIALSDSAGGANNISFRMTIDPGPPAITTTSLPAAQQGTSYAATLTATGGTGSGYMFSSTGLPSGLTVSTAGVISGTPTTTGTVSVPFSVTDSRESTGTASLPLTISAAGTVITTNLPANTAIVNISGTQYGAANSSGTNQIYWSGPFNQVSGGALLEYTLQPGTYTFRAINPADAQTLYPALTAGQLSNVFTAWTYNSPWITSYLAFDSAAASNSSMTQLFSGAEQPTGYSDAPTAYAASVSGGFYNQLHVAARNAAATYTYTATNPQTLIFAVPDYGLGDNSGGVSVLISPTFPTPLSIQTSSLPGGVAGQNYNASLSATGGSGTYSWSVTGLPSGLTLNAQSGAIGGTVQESGTYTGIVITVTDPISGATASMTYSITFSQPSSPPVINNTSLSAGVVGVPYGQRLTASGGTGSYTWSLQSGALPFGIIFNSGGTFSGTPTQGGSSVFVIQVTDQASKSATQQFNLQVNPALSITTTSLPAATQGSAYSQTLGATGRAGPYTWSVTQGTFSNAGLTLDAGSGAIGGTPLTAGTLTFTVQVSDGNSPADTATQVFSLPIALQTPATSDFAVTNAGTGIVRITADGKHTQTLCSGAPCHASNIAADAQGNIYARDQQGISAISPAGVVTPLVNFATSSFFSTGAGLGGIALDGLGNLIFVDNVTDSVYRVKTDGTGLTLVAALPVPSPQERQDAFVAVNSAGNYIVVSDDNGANRVYSFTPTGAPSTIATAQGGTASGISIDGSGNIDVLDYRANKIVQFTPAGVLSTVVALPASSGTYLGLTAETGTGDFISAIAGSAPELDRITPAGAITTIFAGAPLSAPLSIVQIPLLRLTVTPTSLPSGTVSQVYGPVTAMASGGSGTYTWSATGLPPGLSISQAGVIGGTPSTAGSYSVTITANDAAAGAQGSATITVVVAAVPPPPAPPTVSTLSISGSASSINVAQGGSVSATFSASGGTQPYTFSATGLPAGVTLDAAGSLAGSPTQPGNFSGNVKVTDSRSATASTAIAINVLGLTSAALPNGTSGQFYSAAIGAAGGTPPYSFIGTGLPAGLSISSAGNVTGTVKTSNTYSFQVKLSDSAGATVSGTFSVTFAAPRGLMISAAALPSGTVNSPYSQSFTATGGFPAYTWRVSAGSVPGGLSLTSSGTLAGVPTKPGSFQFGVMATDSSGAVATATATVTIQPTPLTVTTQALPSGVTGVPYPQQMLAAMGGVAPYTWAATSGALPAGLTLASNGVLTGTPTVTGSFPLGVTVTDSAGATGTASLTVAVRPNSADLILSTGALTFSLVSPAAVAPAGQAFSVQSTQAALPLAYTVAVSPAAPWLMVTNGSATPDTIQAAIAPAGLALAAGIYQTTITLTCNSSACSGHTQSVPVTLTVTAGPPRLQVVTDLLAFGTSTAALQPMTQTIAIANAGGGSLGVASLSCEAAWCTVASGPGSLAGGVSASIPVTVNPALLTAGFFRTQIDITTSAGTGSVPVTVLIAADSSLTLAPVGDQFSLQAGGAPGNPNDSFLVSVSTPSAVNWTAAVVSATPWITVDTPTGTSSATQPGTVTYSINAQAAQLAQGTYYGVIEVKAGGVVNSPQDYEVVLNVLPANTPVDPLPSPGGLLFITAAGSTAPPQTITIYSSSMTGTGFQASAVTSDGGGWLSVSPNVGNASVAAPGITHAIVNASSLKPGIYRGGVSYSLSATAVRVVNVTAIVTAAASGQAITTSAQPRGVSPHVAGCTPGSLAPTSTELVNNFSAPVAWPQPLSIILSDNCGSLINTGQMVATFSNGDPPLPLTLVDPTKGLYSGTWTPRKAVPQMMILAHASAPSYPDATAQIVGSATPNSAPVLTPHGTLHSFYPLIGAALAPGTIIQIYGQNLASATAQPTTIPLPTSMNGTSVVVGGIPAPLYYVSAGQINAQLPFELDPSKQYQVLVLANGALTTPESVQLSPASPGMAAFADSTLIAQHGDGSLVSAASPAKAGEYLVSYLAGMGTTNATPASGAASPTSPLAMPVDMPTLTINGANAPIAFAGLTPGLVGLYQMNFQVPPGLPAGNITIVVTQGGQGSNQTVLPYQP